MDSLVLYKPEMRLYLFGIFWQSVKIMLDWVSESQEFSKVHNIRSSFGLQIYAYLPRSDDRVQHTHSKGRVLGAHIVYKGYLIRGTFEEDTYEVCFETTQITDAASDEPRFFREKGRMAKYGDVLIKEIEFATRFLEFKHYV